MTPTLTPAYGKDYTSKAKAIAAFREGKDFVYNLLGSSTYCSIRDFKQGEVVRIRYKKLTQVCEVTV